MVSSITTASSSSCSSRSAISIVVGTVLLLLPPLNTGAATPNRTSTLSVSETLTLSVSQSVIAYGSSTVTSTVMPTGSETVGPTLTHTGPETLTLSRTVSVTHSSTLSGRFVSGSRTITVSFLRSITLSATLTASGPPPFVFLEGSNTITQTALTQLILHNAVTGEPLSVAESSLSRQLTFHVRDEAWNTNTTDDVDGSTSSSVASSSSTGMPITKQSLFKHVTLYAPGGDLGAAAVNQYMPLLFTAGSVLISNTTLMILFNVVPDFAMPPAVTEPVPIEVSFGGPLFSPRQIPTVFRYVYIAPSYSAPHLLTLITPIHVEVVAGLAIGASCAAAILVAPFAGGALLLETPMTAGLVTLATCNGVSDGYALAAAPVPFFRLGTSMSYLVGCTMNSLFWLWGILGIYAAVVYFIVTSNATAPLAGALRATRAPGLLVVMFPLLPTAVRCSVAILNGSSGAAATVALVTFLWGFWSAVVGWLMYCTVHRLAAGRANDSVKDPFAPFRSPRRTVPLSVGGTPPGGDVQADVIRVKLPSPLRRLMDWARAYFFERVDVYVNVDGDDDRRADSYRLQEGFSLRKVWDVFLHRYVIERFGVFFILYRFPHRFNFFICDVPFAVAVSSIVGIAIATPDLCASQLGWVAAGMFCARAAFFVLLKPHNYLGITALLVLLDLWRGLALMLVAMGWLYSLQSLREGTGVMLLASLYALLVAFGVYLGASLWRPSPTDLDQPASPQRSPEPRVPSSNVAPLPSFPQPLPGHSSVEPSKVGPLAFFDAVPAWSALKGTTLQPRNVPSPGYALRVFSAPRRKTQMWPEDDLL